jgi:hypothetical protein
VPPQPGLPGPTRLTQGLLALQGAPQCRPAAPPRERISLVVMCGMERWGLGRTPEEDWCDREGEWIGVMGGVRRRQGKRIDEDGRKDGLIARVHGHATSLPTLLDLSVCLPAWPFGP